LDGGSRGGSSSCEDKRPRLSRSIRIRAAPWPKSRPAEGTGSGKYRGNYERLVDIKQMYDPDNLFHLNQNIKP